MTFSFENQFKTCILLFHKSQWPLNFKAVLSYSGERSALQMNQGSGLKWQKGPWYLNQIFLYKFK